MRSPSHLHNQSVSERCRKPRGVVMTFPSGSSEEVNRHLSEENIQGIDDQPKGPSPESVVVRMRGSEILFDDIPNLRDGFVAIDFIFSKLGAFCCFSHDAVFCSVHRSALYWHTLF